MYPFPLRLPPQPIAAAARIERPPGSSVPVSSR